MPESSYREAFILLVSQGQVRLEALRQRLSNAYRAPQGVQTSTARWLTSQAAAGQLLPASRPLERGGGLLLRLVVVVPPGGGPGWDRVRL